MPDFADELFSSGLSEQAAHSYAPHAEVRFTNTGGFLMLQKAANGHPRMLAVASGEYDEGVELDDEDCLLIADWLITQVATDSAALQGSTCARSTARLVKGRLRELLAILEGPDPR